MSEFGDVDWFIKIKFSRGYSFTKRYKRESLYSLKKGLTKKKTSTNFDKTDIEKKTNSI